jgi:hypothetical protein
VRRPRLSLDDFASLRILAFLVWLNRPHGGGATMTDSGAPSDTSLVTSLAADARTDDDRNALELL